MTSPVQEKRTTASKTTRKPAPLDPEKMTAAQKKAVMRTTVVALQVITGQDETSLKAAVLAVVEAIRVGFTYRDIVTAFTEENPEVKLDITKVTKMAWAHRIVTSKHKKSLQKRDESVPSLGYGSRNDRGDYTWAMRVTTFVYNQCQGGLVPVLEKAFAAETGEEARAVIAKAWEAKNPVKAETPQQEPQTPAKEPQTPTEGEAEEPQAPEGEGMTGGELAVSKVTDAARVRSILQVLSAIDVNTVEDDDLKTLVTGFGPYLKEFKRRQTAALQQAASE